MGVARSAPRSFPGEFHEAGLADRAATGRLLADVPAAGPVDAVVDNVGAVRPAPLGEVALSDLDAVFDMNVRTAVQLVQAVLPGMPERSWGRVVNVGSLVILGLPDRTSYGAAEAADEFLARGWAGELAPHGITVNAVAPGATGTDTEVLHWRPWRDSNPRNSLCRRAPEPLGHTAVADRVLGGRVGDLKVGGGGGGAQGDRRGCNGTAMWRS